MPAIEKPTTGAGPYAPLLPAWADVPLELARDLSNESQWTPLRLRVLGVGVFLLYMESRGPTKPGFLTASRLERKTGISVQTWHDLLSDPAVMGRFIERYDRGRYVMKVDEDTGLERRVHVEVAEYRLTRGGEMAVGNARARAGLHAPKTWYWSVAESIVRDVWKGQTTATALYVEGAMRYWRKERKRNGLDVTVRPTHAEIAALTGYSEGVVRDVRQRRKCHKVGR